MEVPVVEVKPSSHHGKYTYPTVTGRYLVFSFPVMQRPLRTTTSSPAGESAAETRTPVGSVMRQERHLIGIIGSPPA